MSLLLLLLLICCQTAPILMGIFLQHCDPFASLDQCGVAHDRFRLRDQLDLSFYSFSRQTKLLQDVSCINALTLVTNFWNSDCLYRVCSSIIFCTDWDVVNFSIYFFLSTNFRYSHRDFLSFTPEVICGFVFDKLGTRIEQYITAFTETV